jgi:DNA-binding CsgD family transcriptional regulator
VHTLADGEQALRGRSNADIARVRGSSPRTVANLLARTFRKLKVRSRAELAARFGGPKGGNRRGGG